MLLIPLIIPTIILLPLISLIAVAFANKRQAFRISEIVAGIIFALVVSTVAIARAYGYDSLCFSLPYLQSFGINFDFELNTFNEILAVMSSIVLFAASLSAKNFIKESEKLYNSLFLVISASTLGVFLTGSLFFLYVFWEISEVAMFFIIYIYGAYNRRYAAIKFIIFSLLSSLLLLVGIILLYAYMPQHTFEISYAIQNAKEMPAFAQLLVFALFLVSFMIKIPIFPFHTWLPDAHTEAPTPGSMILAGILLKFGGYGMLLMFLMLPIALHYSLYLAILFSFSAIYAGFVTIRQGHFKRAIAYTSVVDMGIAALGITVANPVGYAGSLYAMLSHGIVIALMFLVAGSVDESFGTLLIEKLKGIAKSMKGVSYAFLFGIFAIAGLPLTCGFVADLLIFTSVTQEFGYVFLAPLAAVAIITLFMFWLAEKMFFDVSKAIEPYSYVDKGFAYASTLLIVSTIFLGIAPSLLVAPVAFVPI